MATIEQQLTQLQADKQTLVTNLVAKGIEATNDETFTTLVPKVANIQGEKFAPPFVSFREYSGTELDLSNLDTSNIATMRSMFSGCSSLTTLDVSHFDTSNVNDMLAMFMSCGGLFEIDLSSFNTSNVTNTKNMFNNCYSLKKIIINSFLPITSLDMFYNTPISNGTGYVYVPDDMVDTYKTATNWSTYASQIKPISELEGYNNA